MMWLAEIACSSQPEARNFFKWLRSVNYFTNAISQTRTDGCFANFCPRMRTDPIVAALLSPNDELSGFDAEFVTVLPIGVTFE